MIRDLFQKHLPQIYGEKADAELVRRFAELVETYEKNIGKNVVDQKWDEKSQILICYGDQVTSSEKSLKVLRSFFNDENFDDFFSHVHLLTFFPLNEVIRGRFLGLVTRLSLASFGSAVT